VAAALNLINSICKNKDIYLALNEDPELFGEWSDVWTALRNYYNKYRSVPDIELLQEMQPSIEEVSVSGNTDYYLSELKKEYTGERLRSLVLNAGKYLQQGHSPLEITDGLQSQLSRLQRLSTTAQDLDIVDFDMAKEFYDKVRKEAEENGGSVGIPTGFKGIDAFYQTGMAPGHVIYAIGFSSHGKTWWAAKMAEQAWQHGVKPLVISLEMTPEDMRNRIYTMIGEGLLKNSDLQRGVYDYEALEDMGKKAVDKTSFIVASGMDGQEITPNFCRAKIEQHNPGLLVFDYQQLGMDNAKTADMTLRMANFSREMKLLARSANIPIIIISAVTDKESTRQRPPDLGSLAWGRSLEYTADMVIAVHKTDDGLTEFVMRKNRFGELGDMFVRTDYNSGIFEEIYD
jgi:replicative DNA helicase